MGKERVEWYEKILLWFIKPYITADVAYNKTVFCMTKRLFGKHHIIKMWEEEAKINGIKFDYVIYDELKQKEEL